MQIKAFLLIILLTSNSLFLTGCFEPTSTKPKTVAAPLVSLEKPLERLSPESLNALDRADLFEPLIVMDTTPKTDTIATTDNKTVETTPAVDPFQDISLNGIFYHGKKGHSIVILKTADDKPSLILSLGESFPSNVDSAIRVKVSAVTNSTVTLTSGNEKKILKIDNIIGFSSSESKTKASSASSDSKTLSSTTPATQPQSLTAAANGSSVSTVANRL